MGFDMSDPVGRRLAAEFDKERRTERREATAKLNASLDALSNKIVMVMVDQINAAIVRPGPKPEERECYEMAQELHDFKPAMAELVRAVLEQHKVVPTDEARLTQSERPDAGAGR